MPVRFCRYCGSPLTGEHLYDITCGSDTCRTEYKFESWLISQGSESPKIVRSNKKWTPQEVDMMYSLIVYRGYTPSAVATELRRTHRAVRDMIRKLRSRDSRWSSVEVPKAPAFRKKHLSRLFDLQTTDDQVLESGPVED